VSLRGDEWYGGFYELHDLFADGGVFCFGDVFAAGGAGFAGFEDGSGYIHELSERFLVLHEAADGDACDGGDGGDDDGVSDDS